MTYALIRPVCKIVDGVNTRACKLRKNGREEENGLYRNTKQGAKEKQIHEVSKKLKSSFMVKVGEVKALNGVEDNNWCGIIHNTFSEYKTVKQRCLILIQHL